MKPRLGCKVYGSLLALCYLEVVLWTSCILVSLVLATTTAATDSHEYLVRETLNLKHVGSQPQNHEARGAEFKTIEHLTRVESRCRLRRLESLEQVTPGRALEAYFGLRLNNLPEQKGVPAPFTGVKVIL